MNDKIETFKPSMKLAWASLKSRQTKQEIKRNENDSKRKNCGEDGKGIDLIKEAGEIAV